tara:strand:- start:8 stop:148 length:141 start_codon:yes stop_codon:yes gene_type:complete
MESIIIENNIYFTPFTKEMMQSLPAKPWTIPEVNSLRVLIAIRKYY